MLKRIIAIALVLIMSLSFAGCGEKYELSDLPEYAEKQFEISGFWAPYEISEESFKQYKDAGFNTLAMINHSLGNTSEEQFYLGSERTMKALEICKELGLKAILNYNDWMAERVEEDENYNGETPFSKYDLYGDYKDIITGIHICDEPYTRHIPIYGNDTIIEDFKKVYPDAAYMVNLIPITAVSTRGFTTYQEMLDIYTETFMDKFDRPYISVDVYPFHTVPDMDLYLPINYNMIAETAKQYDDAEVAFILQASTGSEFEENLSEGDMRWEVNNALAFGAEHLQYYCYSVPKSFEDDGTVSYMYNHCVLNQDDTPSEIYYYLQDIHKEIQSFASVILSYTWDEALGISGTEEQTFRVSGLAYDDDFNEKTLKNAKHYVEATGTQDLIVSRFDSDEYGEGYMFVNYADRDYTNNITATFKDCGAVAIYGGKGYSGTPQIVVLDEEGKFTLELAYGDGVFITPII